MGAAGPGKDPGGSREARDATTSDRRPTRLFGGMRQAAAARDEAAGFTTSGGRLDAADPAQPFPSRPPPARTGAGGPARGSIPHPPPAHPCPRRNRRPRALLDHPTRLARGRRLRRSSPMARSQWNASAMIGAVIGGRCQRRSAARTPPRRPGEWGGRARASRWRAGRAVRAHPHAARHARRRGDRASGVVEPGRRGGGRDARSVPTPRPRHARRRGRPPSGRPAARRPVGCPRGRARRLIAVEPGGGEQRLHRLRLVVAVLDRRACLPGRAAPARRRR